MSLLYLMLKFISDYAPGFAFDKLALLLLVDLDLIAINQLHQLSKRIRRGGW